MTTILIIWAILGPSIGLLAGCLLTAGANGRHPIEGMHAGGPAGEYHRRGRSIAVKARREQEKRG
ncbi:hypothetical protein [Inquilinus limosus]|uniref:hypothetical protein n=1 Tax=Inquilinus limosus TaxID=171674 RepID=UPI0004008947|nr:hypothetical protein [Inquilinus limosus]